MIVELRARWPRPKVRMLSLRQLREAAGLSREELAAHIKMGVDADKIRRLEDGDGAARGIRTRIALALGVTDAELRTPPHVEEDVAAS